MCRSAIPTSGAEEKQVPWTYFMAFGVANVSNEPIAAVRKALVDRLLAAWSGPFPFPLAP